MPESRNLCVGAVCGLGDYYMQCILVELSEGLESSSDHPKVDSDIDSVRRVSLVSG